MIHVFRKASACILITNTDHKRYTYLSTDGGRNFQCLAEVYYDQVNDAYGRQFVDPTRRVRDDWASLYITTSSPLCDETEALCVQNKDDNYQSFIRDENFDLSKAILHPLSVDRELFAWGVTASKKDPRWVCVFFDANRPMDIASYTIYEGAQGDRSLSKVEITRATGNGGIFMADTLLGRLLTLSEERIQWQGKTLASVNADAIKGVETTSSLLILPLK